METVSSQFLLFFDEQGLGSELRRSSGHGQAGRSAADNSDIVFI
jgi:hypothetical protein